MSKTPERPWICQTANGKYCLMAPAPGLKGWYKMIMGGFEDEDSARKYARREGIEAEVPPRQTPSMPRGRGAKEWINGMALTAHRKQALEILEALADSRGEVSISAGALLEAMGKPLDAGKSSGYQLLTALMDMGLIRRLSVRPAVYKVMRKTEPSAPERHKLKL